MADMPRLENKNSTGRMTCPLRTVDPKRPYMKWVDFWTARGPDTVCSNCGVMHPDEFISWCQRCCEPDSKVRIEPAEATGDWYIIRRGVNNATQGALRAQLDHFPSNMTESDHAKLIKLVGDAVEISVGRTPVKR